MIPLGHVGQATTQALKTAITHKYPW